MNKLYTGLIGLVIGTVGCGREKPQVIEHTLGPSDCSVACQKITDLEKTLEQELAKAQEELAKAKSEAQTMCDARVKEVQRKYAPKQVELPQEVTPQFPKSDLPMHELIKGLAQGKYDTLNVLLDLNEREIEELPLLYKGWSGNEKYSVSYKEKCPAMKIKPVDLPAEHTACEIGSAVSYNPQDNTFEIDSWKTYSVKTDGEEEYREVTESISYLGTGQTLDWSEVTEVVISTPKTKYEEQTFKVDLLEKEVVGDYQARIGQILTTLKTKADEVVKNIHKAPHIN